MGYPAERLSGRMHVEQPQHPPSVDTLRAGDVAGVTPCLAPAATAAIPPRPYPFASSRARRAASRTYPLVGVSRGLRLLLGFLLIEAGHGATGGALAGGVPGYRRLRSPASSLHDRGHLDTLRPGEILRHPDPASVA